MTHDDTCEVKRRQERDKSICQETKNDAAKIRRTLIDEAADRLKGCGFTLPGARDVGGSKRGAKRPRTMRSAQAKTASMASQEETTDSSHADTIPMSDAHEIDLSRGGMEATFTGTMPAGPVVYNQLAPSCPSVDAPGYDTLPQLSQLPLDSTYPEPPPFEPFDNAMSTSRSLDHTHYTEEQFDTSFPERAPFSEIYTIDLPFQPLNHPQWVG